ncbi:MAG: NAD(+) diphosphatase [Lachnospiraceae bacterium]|nr:NAD(+) diphosphatase [Lachnospiraceae bacterium]
MIQDIDEVFDNTYAPKKEKPDDVIICFKNREVFFKNENGNVEFLNRADYDEAVEIVYKKNREGNEKTADRKCRGDNTEMKASVTENRYIFSIGTKAFYLGEITESVQNALEEKGYSFNTMFATRGMKPKEKVFALVTAYHLSVWYNANRFCGACGHRLIHMENMRALECEVCGNTVFPKINPAVIVAVRNGEKILLTKYAGRQYKNYALIAGFNEIGESAEETVRREVMEEAGLKVKNITYYKSQPWGYESDLLLGFYCDVDGDDTIKMDDEELSSAEWVDRSAMEPRNDDLSLTSELMEQFRLGKI